jgi:dynactin 4
MSSSSQTETRHIRPYVHYHCGCPDVNKSTTNLESEKEETFNVNSPRIQFSTFSISKLYFCDDCHQIRCPRCVQEEIVCYYCPNCLFEVPTASVKSERNRCARNCFQCPICQNTLTVLASSEPQPPPSPISPTTVPTVSATGAPYYLSCGVCRWDSQEIGMTFEKATGLACKYINLFELIYILFLKKFFCSISTTSKNRR